MQVALTRMLCSSLTTVLLLLIYAVGLGTATIIEKYYGTPVAKQTIYYSPVFFSVQVLLLVNFVAIVIKNGLLAKRKWGLMMTHGSFMLILLGSLVTHFFGEEGIVHIREGERTDQVFVQDGKTGIIRTLPFTLELVKFKLHRYPGSHSPSAYESELRVHMDGETTDAKVSMNNIFDLKGYRFFQASFDKDEKGTVLSVNKDVYGRNITYAGYLLLALGFVFCFAEKNARFRTLGKKLKEIQSGQMLALLLILSVSGVFLSPELRATATASKTKSEIPALGYYFDREHLAGFSALPVQTASGRIVPMDTFSSEILRKLTGDDTIADLDSNEFLLSVITFPEIWMNTPLIKVWNDSLLALIGLKEGWPSYADCFDKEGRYKLEEAVVEAYGKMPKDRNIFDKDVMKLDERVNILSQLFSFQLLNLFPREDDPNHKWYASGDDLSAFNEKDRNFVSLMVPWYIQEVRKAVMTDDWKPADDVLGMITTYQQSKSQVGEIDTEKLEAEIKYNQFRIFAKCKLAYLITGGLLLVSGFFVGNATARAFRIIRFLLCLGIAGAFLVHLAGIVLRWYIGGYAPFSNAYETMVYVSWVTVLAGWCFVRHSSFTLALSALFGGVILFVSGLNWMDPQITPLVPVLKSPWLMFHVAVIVSAYGFFGISFLLGISNQVLLIIVSLKKTATAWKNKISELSIVNEMSLLIAVALMTVGTILGAVWANESWGRYWGWDPKETWALVTIVVYAAVTHMRLVKRFDNPWMLNTGSVLAFGTVLMTFFGVNYFLSGMHAYGENRDVHHLFIYLYFAAGFIGLLSGVSYFSYRSLSYESVNTVEEPITL